MRWQPLQIVGGAYRDDTRPWSVQDTVNYIPVAAEKGGTRSPSMLRCAPGFVKFCNLGAGPIRGFHNVEGTLYCVAGSMLYRINPDGNATGIGTIPGVGLVSMAHNQVTNGNQLAIAAGGSGLVYSTVTGLLGPITDTGFPGTKAFEFIDGYMVGIDPTGTFAFYSALADATSYNTLDRFQAESQPDKIVGLIATHEQLWLFGERTVQPFSVAGGAHGNFQSDGNMSMEVGCASAQSVAGMDNSVFWLGNDGVVYRADGYTPRRISTHPLEQAISRCNASNAFAFKYEDRGHKIYYLSFLDGQTWGYDAATDEWHRRKSYGIDRWRINSLAYWGRKWIAGDYITGMTYRMDWDVQAEAGTTMERRRTLGVMADAQNALVVNAVEIVANIGSEWNATVGVPGVVM